MAQMQLFSGVGSGKAVWQGTTGPHLHGGADTSTTVTAQVRCANMGCTSSSSLSVCYCAPEFQTFHISESQRKHGF